MAFVGNDKNIPEAQRTGYTFQGKELIVGRKRGRPPKLWGHPDGKNGIWSEAKRIEAITLFAALGDVEKVADLAKVPIRFIRKWVTEPWATDILYQFRAENDAKIAAKFSDIVHSALDKISDRLENGDYVLQRNGEMARKPVDARILASISTNLLDKKQLLEGKPTSRSEKVTEDSRLKKLEMTFLKLGTSRRQSSENEEKDITDVEYEEVTQPSEIDQSGRLGNNPDNSS